MLDVERFRGYTDKPDSAWNSVEKGVFEYVFGRYFKNSFNWLQSSENRLIPAITTKFGRMIPEDFRILDLGTGTGHIPETLIDIGVKQGNIVGLDNNPEMFTKVIYPVGVHKIRTDIRKFLPALRGELPGFGNFDLVTANMVFHMLSYKDYLASLKQVRQVVTDCAQLYIMVPHPLRSTMDSIPDYHRRKMTAEKAPWGEEITYGTKTVSDYCRGLKQAGFRCWLARTTGVGMKLEDNFLLEDEMVWSEVQDRKEGTGRRELPHYFRLWLMAYPE